MGGEGGRAAALVHFSTGHLPSEKMCHKRPLVARGYPGECVLGSGTKMILDTD